MTSPDLATYIQSSSFTISEEDYSILQTTIDYEDAFATVRTGDSLTLVVKDKEATYHIPSKEILAIDRDWKLITIENQLPMDLVGFLAAISQALAEAQIPIFVISSFDTDHILIKKDYIPNASRILVNLGFQQ